MKKLTVPLGALAIAMAFALPAAAEDIPSAVTLFKNVNIFDGRNEQLLVGYDVLVVKNLIEKIDKDIKLADTYEIDVKTGGYKAVVPGGNIGLDAMQHPPSTVTVYEPEKMTSKAVEVHVIDGDNRVLMPGLIDAHWHTMLSFWPVGKVLTTDIATLSLAAAKAHEKTLMRGFTTVRDAGGAAIPIAKAVDSGLIDGPRMYPSGPVISQTSGHGDWRNPLNIPEEKDEPLDYTQKSGQTLIADGVPEVMKRTREVLRMGASQVKAMAGGGVNSLYDPLDVTQYTFEEAKAICDVAATWNTYVMIHANTDAAIRQWVEAGAKSVEHGFFIEDETAQLMAENGVWWSMQAMEATGDDAFVFDNPASNAKFVAAVAGIDKVVALAKKYNVNIAWGTDLQFDPTLLPKQGKFLTKLSKWFTPYEALKIATHDNAKMLKMSGPRDPYPDGELGVIQEGAYADMILVDGNPLENLDLVADPDKNFVVIMKDGKIYKNTLD